MEVSEYSFRRVLEQRVMQLTDFVPLHAGAAHPRIDGEMPWSPRFPPAIDRGCVAECRRQLVSHSGVEVTDENWRKDQDPPRDSSVSQLIALADGRNTEPPGVETLQNTRDAFGP